MADVRELKTPLQARLENILGKDWRVAYVFMAPTVILMGGLIAYPFLRAFYISFTNTTSLQIGPFVGLTNYINLWKDIFFRRSVMVTAQFTLSAVFLKLIVGILAFAAIGTSKDVTGEFLNSLFLVMAASLGLSWLLADASYRASSSCVRTPYTWLRVSSREIISRPTNFTAESAENAEFFN